MLAHDVGLSKLLAGTLQLDPTGARAMEDCRHPITEAGIGPLLDTISKRWALELNPAESVIEFRDDMVVGEQRCTHDRIDAPRAPTPLPVSQGACVHRPGNRLADPVRSLRLAETSRIRTRARRKSTPTLKLKLNVGLKDLDFEASNAAYSFGRF